MLDDQMYMERMRNAPKVAVRTMASFKPTFLESKEDGACGTENLKFVYNEGDTHATASATQQYIIDDDEDLDIIVR
jgi:hypothetical protein